jgi:hypothetical protein
MAFRWAAIAAALPFIKMAAIVSIIAAVLEDVYVWLKGGESVTGKILEKFKSLGVAITEGFGKAESYVLNTLVGWSKAIYNIFFETIPQAVRDAWQAIKNMPMKVWAGVKNVVGLTNNNPNQNVNPTSMAGNSKAVAVNNQTTVNLTVPPGTPQEQSNFLVKASEKYFSNQNKFPSASDMAVLAP